METKKLTAIHEGTEREIEMMVGKAMCAYENWQVALKCVYDDYKLGEEGYTANYIRAARNKSEYEATAHILEFFVQENIYDIQRYVLARAKAEFGIED